LAALEIDDAFCRIGQSKVFFRTGVLAHLEEERDLKLTDLVRAFQSTARGYLARRAYRRRVDQSNAIKVLQRNGLAWLKLRNWQWWRLFTKVKPLLEVSAFAAANSCVQVTNTEEKIAKKEEELKSLRDEHLRTTAEYKHTQETLAQLEERERRVREELAREAEERAEADERLQRMQDVIKDLAAELEDKKAQLAEEEERNSKEHQERKRMHDNLQDLEAQLGDEETLRQKLQLEKNALDQRLRSLEETCAALEEQHKQARL
jgi:myosin protein heavy chain